MEPPELSPAPARPRLVKRGCGAFLDTASGLEWFVQTSGKTWHQATDGARSAAECGGGWALPSEKQLLSLHRSVREQGVRGTLGVTSEQTCVWTNVYVDEFQANCFCFDEGQSFKDEPEGSNPTLLVRERQVR